MSLLAASERRTEHLSEVPPIACAVPITLLPPAGLKRHTVDRTAPELDATTGQLHTVRHTGLPSLQPHWKPLVAGLGWLGTKQPLAVLVPAGGGGPARARE